ncbi:hypothetical protein [Holzapfeliella sp. JNUCC 72]
MGGIIITLITTLFFNYKVIDKKLIIEGIVGLGIIYILNMFTFSSFYHLYPLAINAILSGIKKAWDDEEGALDCRISDKYYLRHPLFFVTGILTFLWIPLYWWQIENFYIPHNENNSITSIFLIVFGFIFLYKGTELIKNS